MNLKPNQSLQTAAAQDEAETHPLTRFEKMTGVTVWTNRLDARLKSRLDSLKRWLTQLSADLHEIESTLNDGNSAKKALVRLRAHNDQWYQEVYPELVELCVVASDHVYMLDSAACDLAARFAQAKKEEEKLKNLIQQLEHSPACRIGRAALRPVLALKALFSGADPNAFSKAAHETICSSPPSCSRDSAQDDKRDLRFDFGFGVREKPHAAVDNTNTGLSIFSDWVSVFHHQGKYYGSPEPCIDDHMPHLVELHERVRLTEMRILELGPFEGAHTKQMLDLGAAHVTAIESNTTAYLKCLTIKSEFALHNAEFIFGDCNKVLRRPEFRAQKFDFCLASGVLYHMEDPLSTLDLVLSFAPLIFVWTQVASEHSPAGPWMELEDTDGRRYRGRKNTYQTKEHWGGVGPGAVWLDMDDLFRAFADRGFKLENITESNNAAGKVVSFLGRADTNCGS